MFIEDETEAVFNEIRNLKKDNDESEEEMTPAATEKVLLFLRNYFILTYEHTSPKLPYSKVASAHSLPLQLKMKKDRLQIWYLFSTVNILS